MDRRSPFTALSATVAFSASPGLVQAEQTPSGPWKLGNIVVEQAWARLGSDASKTCAVYLTVHNKSAADDYLLGVSSDASTTTAIHETQVKDGVARMEPIPGGLNMTSHAEVVMRPGSIHIMLTGISGAVVPGGMLPVSMFFRDAGTLDFEVPVLPLGAKDPTVKHKGHDS
ncbi:MAG: copper chaperone PCu(A)C [Aestuariivirga sp.]